jgi:hypothetical protein
MKSDGDLVEVSYMFLEGCPEVLGCTLLLRGGSHDQLMELKQVTFFYCRVFFPERVSIQSCSVTCLAPNRDATPSGQVARFATFIAYNLKLETAFLLDSCADLSSVLRLTPPPPGTGSTSSSNKAAAGAGPAGAGPAGVGGRRILSCSLGVNFAPPPQAQRGVSYYDSPGLQQQQLMMLQQQQQQQQRRSLSPEEHQRIYVAECWMARKQSHQHSHHGHGHGGGAGGGGDGHGYGYGGDGDGDGEHGHGHGGSNSIGGHSTTNSASSLRSLQCRKEVKGICYYSPEDCTLGQFLLGQVR